MEKFLSMVLTTCVIAPLLGGALTLGIDGLICVLDPTCGNSIVEGVREMGIGMMNLSREFEEFATNAESQAAVNELISSIEDMEKSVTSPFMIITNFFALTLPFLCGAVWFKSSKTVKTILAMMAFSMVFSIIATPFMTGWLKSAFEINNDLEAINAITENGLFNKIVLINNISKTMTNVALMLGIWFRIKSLKH